eukprot:scaffold29864_cov63-Phaeocystis_antarctica.AAC.7
MAATKAKLLFSLVPRLGLVLFIALATKLLVALLATKHFINMHDGHEHEWTACTGCNPAA